MNTISQIKIAQANKEQMQTIIALPQTEKLPVEDLPASLNNFFVAIEDNKIVGRNRIRGIQ